MSRIRSYLQDELDRLNRMEVAYQKRLEELPKGKVYYKSINEKKYPYLQHRLGYKLKSEYIKGDRLESIQKDLRERKSHEAALKSIREDIKFINRALRLK